MLKHIIAALLLTFGLHAQEVSMPDIYTFEVTTIDGETTTLAPWRGKVMLIVNVASKCGFTPQYDGLEALYEKYKERGFVVLGFPCNQFGSQEPGTDAQIADFCRINFGVTFPMFSKIEVNGDDAHPLYQYLKEEQGGTLGFDAIKWNFTKFLVDRTGQVTARFSPAATPESLEEEIEALL